MREFDVAYFTASCDSAETNRKFAESLDLDYVILSDPDQEVAKQLGVLNEDRGIPQRWTYYIDEEGKLLHIDKKVSPGQHGADIVAKLKELGVDKAE